MGNLLLRAVACCSAWCAASAALAEVRFEAGDGWTPFAAAQGIRAGSAIDFSALRPTGAPAGRFGRVVAKGATFEFENLPGVAQRFYGVNLCGGANYPDHATSERFCATLARMGYNAVRIHHHDNALVRGDGALEPNAENFDRLDYLIATCVEHGLYMTTDLYVSRRVTYRAIGIDRDGVMPSIEFKELVPVHEGAYENFIAFSRLFLSHRNPYTGRRYADEPALAWIAFINEGNLGNRGTERFRKHPEWRTAWQAWIDGKAAAGVPTADLPREIPERYALSPGKPDCASSAFTMFLADVEDAFDKRAMRFFRDEMKCRALTANMSSWMFPASFQIPRTQNFDYVDDHFYIDHPVFEPGRDWRLPSTCANVNPLRDACAGVPFVAARRALDRPFTITEFNYSGPGRFRGLGGVVAGTIAALQGWSGLWRFAWSHSLEGVTEPAKQRMDYFNLAGDPLLLAGERASICLFLRGDLPELAETYGVRIDPEAFRVPEPFPNGLDARWRWAAWYRKIGSVVAASATGGEGSAGTYPEGFRRKNEFVRQDLFGTTDTNHWPTAGSGHVKIDPATGAFRVATPRTAGGFVESGGFRAGPLRVADVNVPATVWVSSLDTNSVETSVRLLLTHLTNVQNSGTTYEDATLKRLLNWGTLPHLMQNGTCSVSLSLRPGRWRVYALEADGARRREVAAAYADGRLSFGLDTAADGRSATFLYELTCEKGNSL